MASSTVVVTLADLDSAIDDAESNGLSLISVQPAVRNMAALGERAPIVLTFIQSAGAPTSSVIVQDTFAALGSGVSITGWTPDIINTPGNTWAGVSVSMKGDGAGNVVVDTFATTPAAGYNTGITDNKIKVSTTLNQPASLSKPYVYAFGDVSPATGGPLNNDCLALDLNFGAIRWLQVVAGSITTLASTPFSFSTGVDYLIEMAYDGTDLRAYINSVEITALARIAYSVPAGLVGNPWAGIGGVADVNMPGKIFRDFKVTDLV